MKLKHILIVLKKELKDIFRDKKTIFASIIMPMIMFPILFGFMGLGSKQVNESAKQVIPIAVESSAQSSFTEFLKAVPSLKIVEVTDYKKAIEDNQIKAVLHIDQDFDEKLNSNIQPVVTIEYDDTSQSATAAADALKETIKAYSDNVVAKRLTDLKLSTDILRAVEIKEKSAVPDKGGTGFLIFSMMLPLFLTMWSAASGLPAATDLGAGEKERGTLEPLLATKAKRLSLLVGKFLAVTVAALVGTAASLVGLSLTMKINPEMMGSVKGLSTASIIIIAIACITLALIFSALQLAVSVYARSFKEASTYLSPLIIIIMVPSYLTMFAEAKAIPSLYLHIPLLNTVCIIKEVIAGIFNPGHMAIVFVWSIIYIALAMAFALNMFKKESVIFRV